MIDFHCDTFLKLIKDKKHLKNNDYAIDLEKLQKAGSFGQFFASFIYLEGEKDPFTRAVEMIDYGKKEIEKSSDIIKLATDYDTYIDNKKNNLISAFLAIEEGGTIMGDFNKLNTFYDMGVRLITLTWNFPNEIGYPNSKFNYKNNGLKNFGKELVTYMNNKQMIIDVSHLSDGGFYDVLEFSSQPFIASHSNAREVCNHSRNLTDDMIKKLSDAGGITGINFCSNFLDGSDYSKIESMVKHINHIKNVGGIDVIALGTDFDGIESSLEIEDISKMELLKNALNINGFSGKEIDKIFYENGERIIKDIL